MKLTILIKSAFIGAIALSSSIYAGVYKGTINNATFEQLLIDVNAKSEQLDMKISEAKGLGLSTGYAQVSQVTIKLFKEIFAPWDKNNLEKVQSMYDAKYFSQFDPVGAKGLPFDELADSIEVAEAAIAELQQQIDGAIQLTPPPNFKTGKLVLNGANYELDGNAVIAGKFFWQPNDKDIMEAYGYGGEGYYSVQDLDTETTLKNWRQSNLLTLLKDQEFNNRSPIQFFLGHIVPQSYWLRDKYPEAFSKGSRLFTDYDIDNPIVKNWLDTLFNQQLSAAVYELDNTERVHMIANEPTFSIREGGVDADRGVSEYTLAKYATWLENKYQTIAKLNEGYDSNFANFEQLKTIYTIPLSLSYQGSAVWYDWNRFNMDRVNEWFTYLHNGVHSADANAQTHIKIMGERALHTPYQDEGLDFEFIAKLVDMPGSDNQSSSLAAEWDLRHDLSWQNKYSLEWRAQTMMLDFNKSIVPDKHFYDSEWHGLSGARWRDFHMSPEYVRSTLWLAATHGLGSLTSWVWNRKEDGAIDPRADFIGTSVTQPIQLDAYGRTLKELNAHGNKVSALVAKKRNYLIYYNKDAAIQDAQYTSKMAEIYEALKLLNVPTGFTTPAELFRANVQTQVIIIPPTTYISANDLADLTAFVEKGGKTVLFDKVASFTKTELGKNRANPNTFMAMSALTVLDILVMADQLKSALTDVTWEQSISVELTDTKNNPTYGVLSQQFDDEETNQTIISLVNVSQENRTVKLSSKLGIPSDVVNVITKKKLPAEIIMKPMDILLVSIGSAVEDTSTGGVTVDNSMPTANTPKNETASSSSGGSMFIVIFLLISMLMMKASVGKSLLFRTHLIRFTKLKVTNHCKATNVFKVTLLAFALSACQTPLNITENSNVTSSSSKAFIMVDANETIGSIEIYDDRAYDFLDEKTLISVRGKGFDWVEGPVWIDDGNYLLFSDIPKNLIRKFSLEKGNEIYLENTGFAIPSNKGPGSNGLLLNDEKKLVLMQTGERQIALMQSSLEQPKASYKALAANYQGMRLNGTNDGVFDRQGNLYFTDPPIGLDTVFNKDNKLIEKQYKWQLTKPRRVQETPFAGIYRLSKKGDLTLVDNTLTVPNGIGLSPDEKTLYVAVSDTKASAWFAFDVLANGALGKKRMFYNAQHLTGQPEQQGYPDGMAVHSSGIIFATGPGGVWLFDQQGKALAKIKTGLLTSNCTFTTDEKYLFITADDFLLSIPLK